MIRITEKPFGKAYGRPAKLFVLDSGALRAGVSDLGCTIAFIEAKDGEGKPVNTVLAIMTPRVTPQALPRWARPWADLPAG